MRVFQEVQKFNQIWLQILLLSVAGITIGGMLWAYPNVAEEDKTTFFATSIPAALITIAITAGMYMVQLRTRIDETGIHFGFWPFQRELKTAAWHEIDRCYVRKYRPLTEFGGWGYKYSMSGRGKVYNTKGNMGIQIVFKNEQKILVGTQKPDEAIKTIERFTKNNLL